MTDGSAQAEAAAATEAATAQTAAPADQPWALRYWLQARDNPDLLVSTARVWQSEHTPRLDKSSLE